MAQFVHFDEARAMATDAIRNWLARAKDVTVLLVTDLFGKMRLVLFPSGDADDLASHLAQTCGSWWSGEVLQAERLDEVTRQIFEDARLSARTDEVELRLRLVERHRSRTAWFARPLDPPWKAEEGPPIVVFYSFKGGLGRSTLLASFAIQRAHIGERVCVIDMDLDSPGVGRLLAADTDGLTASWGVVDFLLEHRLPDVPFEEYWHRCDRVSGDGDIRVMPSGALDERYVDKLGRVDLEEAPSAHESGLWQLLERTRDYWKPNWILLDARTGISEPAGQLLSGIAHLHVLLGTVQEQSWQGLDRILDRLGKERVLAELSQAEVLLVQAMVPIGDPETGKRVRERFAGRAESTFEERYYAEADIDTDTFWTVEDTQSEDAPHVPQPIEYDPRLASFLDIADVADPLIMGGYAEVGVRIASRFKQESDI